MVIKLMSLKVKLNLTDQKFEITIHDTFILH